MPAAYQISSVPPTPHKRRLPANGRQPTPPKPQGTAQPAPSASRATAFRLDDKTYLFVLDTSKLSAGDWQLQIVLGDGAQRTGNLSLLPRVHHRGDHCDDDKRPDDPRDG